ncbi:MAG: V-type ATP synthase subunit D [Oscillospiraceae bacterium]|nr:V-type ATP synthase subunit D [Oscillospiraceae bacterium]
MPNVIPTKGGLLAARRTLSLARLGFELMDRKRNILIREMMALIDAANELQGKIDDTFGRAYAALLDANISLGLIGNLTQAVELDDSVRIRFRSVMGVEIPAVTAADSEPDDIPYGLAFINTTLDRAYVEFLRLKTFICRLAEMETSVYRLAYAIKKTQKRANALQNIIIPNLTADVKYIVEALEEKEREEFVRLKVLKNI